jgi:hypothetical protein
VYRIVDHHFLYLTSERLPATWGDFAHALGYKLKMDAERVIKRLWPHTARLVGAKVVWEE